MILGQIVLFLVIIENGIIHLLCILYCAIFLSSIFDEKTKFDLKVTMMEHHSDPDTLLCVA